MFFSYLKVIDMRRFSIFSFPIKGFHWSKIQNLDKKVNRHESWLLGITEHADFKFGIKYVIRSYYGNVRRIVENSS